MEAEETALWDRLGSTQELVAAMFPSRLEANRAYASDLRRMTQDLARCVYNIVSDGTVPGGLRECRLHACRRKLAIIQQEHELLTLDEPQSRAVGEDGAFIALGRCIKERAFRTHFGRWSGVDLIGNKYNEREMADRDLYTADDTEHDSDASIARLFDLNAGYSEGDDDDDDI
ncbi:hypothetical protein K488DRAFT_92375 [Vararia minispora EC-137]|uniref:Uncharacterized protein n=1 Tax=Vararia minispora EC-137 TaxID=1314806 RepID=A0ACB8Q455_9AGAM|nr:hypothetical protein K488DRAFT_92375 [Vararia minispora EC-137]